jgi:quercetin dioxygenase-like cupin family protein
MRRSGEGSPEQAISTVVATLWPRLFQALRHSGVTDSGCNQKEEDDMELIGKALSMAELVAYQDGSVVSKTLIDKKIGTITLFSFDVGQGLSEHTAPFDAFVQVVDGEAEVTIEGEPHRVTAGQMIIMPANKPHALKAVKPFKMLLVMIRA